MKRKSKTDWARVKAMKDPEIDFSDSPPLDNDFFKKAVLYPMAPKQTAYCPHCRTVTNLRVTTTLRIADDQKGTAETVVMSTYHCESCCSFVRSEEDVL